MRGSPGAAWMLAAWLAGACAWTAVAAAPAATPSVVLSVDPSKSTACERALHQLDALQAAAGRSASGAASTDLQTARRQAATACLGPAALNTPARAGRLRVPDSVPPVPGLQPPVRPVVPAAPGSAERAPARNAGTLTLTGCDTNGCWASDGTRLTRSGGLLLGPRGACTATGAVLNCP